MKAYNKAELQIVRVNNNDIVTASTTLPKGTTPVSNPSDIQAPGRRSIWD